MTKKDLNDFHIVEFDNGCRKLVIDINMKYISDNLESNYKGVKRKIIKVYEFNKVVYKRPAKHKSVYDLKNGDKYWFMNASGDVCNEEWEVGSSIDIDKREIGNVSLTEKDCLKEVEYKKAYTKVIKRIAELNDGWTPDWEEYESYKFHIFYDVQASNLKYVGYKNSKEVRNELYLQSTKLCRQLISEMEEELKIILEVE